jgi:hypothetical protein
MIVKCEGNQFRAHCSLGLFVLTTVLMWLAIGCQAKTPMPAAAVPTPAIGEPKVGAPTPLKPGEEAGVSVEVSSAAGVALSYTWFADGGEIIRGQGSPAITYRAPHIPGTYNIRVVINWDGQSVEKITSIKIIEEPTPIPASVPPTDTPVPLTPTPVQPTDTPVPPTGTPMPSLPSDAPVVNAIHVVGQPPAIDGRLDEEIWSQAQPLTYAVHPASNDSTTVVVRLLWDDKYLYAGFDVSDTQVEGSNATPYDGDSVSIVFDNGAQIQECRHSLLDDGWATATTERYLKGTTTFDKSDDQDEGYSIEMRIPWVRTPPEGSTIAADFLSVDHDYNPGGLFDDPDTVFSKISWDGDGSINTAMKGILLLGQP